MAQVFKSRNTTPRQPRQRGPKPDLDAMWMRIIFGILAAVGFGLAGFFTGLSAGFNPVIGAGVGATIGMALGILLGEDALGVLFEGMFWVCSFW